MFVLNNGYRPNCKSHNVGHNKRRQHRTYPHSWRWKCCPSILTLSIHEAHSWIKQSMSSTPVTQQSGNTCQICSEHQNTHFPRPVLPTWQLECSLVSPSQTPRLIIPDRKIFQNGIACLANSSAFHKATSSTPFDYISPYESGIMTLFNLPLRTLKQRSPHTGSRVQAL